MDKNLVKSVLITRGLSDCRQCLAIIPLLILPKRAEFRSPCPSYIYIYIYIYIKGPLRIALNRLWIHEPGNENDNER